MTELMNSTDSLTHGDSNNSVKLWPACRGYSS